MREDSLCWSCQRSTSDKQCPWIGGKEVQGWEAEPTILTHYMNGVCYTTNSYQVNKCPLYKEDYKQITTEEIAMLIGVSAVTVTRTRTKALRTMLKEKGLDLRTSKDKFLRNGKVCGRRLYYTKPIEE